jgi:dUTP pyrophosphatase
MSYIKFKKLSANAIIPTRANKYDAGLDVYASADVEIPASRAFVDKHNAIGLSYEDVLTEHLLVRIGQASVPTGITVEIPQGFYGKIESRSGVSFRYGVETGAGVVDSGYRGEIGIKLYNTTDKPYHIKKGDRIAQLIILPVTLLEPVEVPELRDGERGENGFGSSGR